MKRIILFLSLTMCFVLSAFAQMQAVTQANELYAKGNYQLAAKQYEEILAIQGVAPELYYNLGNAYFKMNETGRSILNYERALRLSPTYENAQVNLELAQQKVVDNINQAPTFFIGRWIDELIKLLTSNQWIIISLGLFLFSLVSAFMFIFGSSHQLRKTSFYSGVILLAISVVCLAFSGLQKNYMTNHSEAVVMSGVVVVKSSPDESGTDLFQLHEGTKVTIKSSLGGWSEIKLKNGSIGWVEQVNIEKI